MVPAYGRYFNQSPNICLPVGRLLYAGIALNRIATRASKHNLSPPVRYHFRGNTEGSTLRLTLSCLPRLELRHLGSRKRLTFGKDDEKELTT
ncbi:GIY-YIG nuclease family protein [Streptosporangium sp. NPDC000509]|uniref:GIY-YIG nuclease family protein n=1 Tax=Streptosporangium sp. NPDC000509 TaxID=3366186 RepID=UPI00368D629D